MQLSEDTYVPALRWRQAEYQALERLEQTVKDQIVPLITIPDVEYDFEQRQPKKTVDEHVYPFIMRYHKKWGQRPAWIALNEAIANGRMDDGSHVFDYVFNGLRPNNAKAIPALPLATDPETIAAAARAVARDGQGAAILVRLEDLMAISPQAKLVALAKDLQVELNEIDLIIDLGSPNFEPYDVFATALIAAMPRLGDLMVFRNFVLVSTAIPEKLLSYSDTFSDGNLYHGDTNHVFGGSCAYFKVLGQATKSTQPSQGSFDDPAFGHHLESLGWFIGYI